MRIRGIEANRLLDQLNGAVMHADLVREHSEKIKRIGVARVGGEDSPVDFLRFRQASRLVVLYAKLDRLTGRGHLLCGLICAVCAEQP